jgi:hypothetical protein
VRLGATALGSIDETRKLEAKNLEAAVLERARPRRAFRRIEDPEVAAALQTAS